MDQTLKYGLCAMSGTAGDRDWAAAMGMEITANVPNKQRTKPAIVSDFILAPGFFQCGK
jgi:hypothetical protein